MGISIVSLNRYRLPDALESPKALWCVPCPPPLNLVEPSITLGSNEYSGKTSNGYIRD